MSTEAPTAEIPTTNGNGNHDQEATKEPMHIMQLHIGRDTCFVCRGFGHWARECTSLPGNFLRENAPKCYCCSGTGHYARFCPNILHGRQFPPFWAEEAYSQTYSPVSPIWYPFPVQRPPFYVLEPAPPPPEQEAYWEPAGYSEDAPRGAQEAKPEGKNSGSFEQNMAILKEQHA